MASIATHKLGFRAARGIKERIASEENVLYLTVGRHTEYSGGANNIPQPLNNNEDTDIDLYRNMVFGKRATDSELQIMVPRYEWATDTVYTQYDSDVGDLYNSNFFVAANAGAEYHIFKCLYNNDGANSTIKPDATATAANDTFYETSDGYQWKWMYTVDSTTFNRFATDNFMPVIADTDVSGNAVAGAIDVIIVSDGGAGYDNYVSNVSYTTAGNNTTFKVDDDSASTLDDYFNDTIMYVTTGTGSGEFRTVVDYFANADGKWAVVNNSFDATLDVTTQFDLSPKVNIVGTGNETADAGARAVVNTSSNSIYRVEVLDRGAGYDFYTVSVLASNVVTVTSTAELDPVFGPAGGHGADAEQELGGRYLGISVQFANTEANTVPIDNDYRTLSAIINPTFANVAVNFASADGTFQSGETFYRFQEDRLKGTVSVSSSSTTVTGTGTALDTLSAGDMVYITDTDNSLHMVGTVSTVTNSTQIILASNSLFTDTDSEIGIATVRGMGQVINSASTIMYAKDVTREIEATDRVIGLTSGAYVDSVANVQINGFNKDFDTFVQTYRYEGTPSGSFTEDETGYIGSISTANAIFHSSEVISGTTYYNFTNQIGDFDVSDTIVGNSSAAELVITAKYIPDVTLNSGDTIYVENVSAISRATNQTETAKVVIKF